MYHAGIRSLSLEKTSLTDDVNATFPVTLRKLSCDDTLSAVPLFVRLLNSPCTIQHIEFSLVFCHSYSREFTSSVTTYFAQKGLHITHLSFFRCDPKFIKSVLSLTPSIIYCSIDNKPKTYTFQGITSVIQTLPISARLKTFEMTNFFSLDLSELLPQLNLAQLKNLETLTLGSLTILGYPGYPLYPDRSGSFFMEKGLARFRRIDGFL